MNLSTDFSMSRGEAWRGVVIPRHWIWALILLAGYIAVPLLFSDQVEPNLLFAAMAAVAFGLYGCLASRSFDVPTTVTLTDATLTVVRPVGTAVVPWSEVTRFSARHRHWIVRKGGTVAIIPMLAFDADDRAAIALLVKRVKKD